MNKKLLLFICLLLFIPTIVNAKEYCNVENGNGKDIGSEISCGDEHFYIIGTNNNSIKMISKYNLYVGANYNKIKLDINKIYYKLECTDTNCNNTNWNTKEYYFDSERVSNYSNWKEKIKEKYNFETLKSFDIDYNYDSNKSGAIYDTISGEKYTLNNKTYINKTYKLYPYELILESTKGYALQNKQALGVTGEKGNANYPIYATLYLFPSFNENEKDNTKDYDNFENGYLNFNFKDTSSIKNYLNTYKANLNSMGYEVSSVDMINMKEIKELVNTISGKTLPLSDWYNASLNSTPEKEELDNHEIYNLGDLKEYLSNDYKWLWNTTYWTKTFALNELPTDGSLPQVYFVSSSGEICYSDSNCSGIPRAGIRPVVTIDKSNIKYKISIETDGNGTIEAIREAFGGDKISFKVSTKRGYRLSSLTITTDSGESVEFEEGDITKNKDNTISISTNKLTMPYDNITIKGKWTSDNDLANLVNPQTGESIVLFNVLFSLIISTIIVIISQKKLNELKK